MPNHTQALRSHIYAEMRVVYSGNGNTTEPSDQEYTIGRLINDKIIDFRALGAHEDEIGCISAIALLDANKSAAVTRNNNA